MIPVLVLGAPVTGNITRRQLAQVHGCIIKTA